MSEFLVHHPTFREYPHLKSSHVEEKVGIVFTVNGDKTILPLNGRHGARESVLNLPKYSTTPGKGGRDN